MSLNKLAAFSALALTLAGPVAAETQSPVLLANPTGTLVLSAPHSELFELYDGTFGYVPAGHDAEAIPLLMVFHGTGGRARPMVELLQESADLMGFAIVAPSASGDNWALVDNFFDDYEGRAGSRIRARHPAARFGSDVGRVDTALKEIFSRVRIDPTRIWLFGWSHGGSYAMSLGLHNPQLFDAIAAVAPGLLLAPERTDPTQRFFIAHGDRDKVQGRELSETIFVPILIARGHSVEYFSFEGGHEITPEVLMHAIRFFFELPAGETK